MKLMSWSWLLILGICLTEARYRTRRPGAPVQLQSAQLYKKQWPMLSRISMGNNFYVGGNFPHKRMSYKPSPNYRIRRPPPMFNVLQTTWKNHVPAIGTINNRVALPQRPPVKDFHSMNKLSEYSPEYKPEYRPEPQLAPTHRRDIDDDKGPIHTIPAPNLSPADKPYTPETSMDSEKSLNNIPHQQHQLQTNDVPYYNSNLQINSLGTNSAPRRPIITSPTPTPHQYEVTETNEIGQTIQPTFLIPEIDVTRVADLINSDLQGNEVFLNHPTGPNEGVVGTNVQFGQANPPMQTNLHGSLHVRFPGTAVAQSPYELDPRIPNFQDLLQQQQQQQQQQLAELLQPESLASFPQPQMHSFNYDEQSNKPQQKQQHIYMGQNYASGRVTADYNIEPESTDERSNIDSSSNEGLDFIADGKEPSGNNIEFEESNNQRGETTYFNKATNNNGGGISSQFYTTLPSREAAEKLAALAAAGNVNSQLITQLRKQQGDETHNQPQNEEPIPGNHKDEDYQMGEREQAEEKYYERQQQQYDQQQQQQEHYDQQRQQLEEYEQQIYDRQQEEQDYKQEYGETEYDQQQKRYKSQPVEENDRKYEEHHFVQDSQPPASKKRIQSKPNEDQRVIKIVVPNTAQYEEDTSQENSAKKDNVGDMEYDYDAEDKGSIDTKGMSSTEIKTMNNQSSQMEFGTRLRTKTTDRNE